MTIDDSNVAKQHLCCALGSDPPNRAHADTKRRWLVDRFDEGLVFRRFDGRGKFFAETMPIERCWKPLKGRGALVIHCLWVSGRFQGKGLAAELLADVVARARADGRNSVAIVTSPREMPFLTDKRFFAHHGFEVVDTAPPHFELLALRLKKGAATPRFTGSARTGRTTLLTKGMALIYTHQCPFMETYAGLLAAVLKRRGVPHLVRRLERSSEVRAHGSPFGTFGLYWNGALLTHVLMTPKKLETLLDTLGA